MAPPLWRGLLLSRGVTGARGREGEDAPPGLGGLVGAGRREGPHPGDEVLTEDHELPAGGVRAQFSTETNIRLMRESIEICRSFAATMKINVWFRQGGYLFLTRTPERARMLEESVAMQNRCGLPTRLLEPSEARRIVPELSVEGVLRASYNPEDGVVFPWPFVWGYAQAAQARGVKIATFTEVVGLETKGARVTGVRVRPTKLSPLDANASLANAGIVYLMLRDWKLRGRGEDLRTVYETLTHRLESFPEARTMVLVPPPIQGLGLSGGFQMQLELTDGSGDFVRLQQVADQIVSEARKSPVIRMALTPLRAQVPQLLVDINRSRAESLGVSVGDAQETLATYLGSSFANFFTLFGHTYTVYAQADSRFRRNPADLTEYAARSQSGVMVPLGSLATVRPTQGPAVVTLYNLRPSATINGAARDGHSSGEALKEMEVIAARVMPPGMTYEWTAMSYQEKLAEGSSAWVFGLSLLLVFLVLAGQFENWRTPLSVILAVPLALVGTVTALLGLGVANNLYVQIGLVLLIALSAKNSILIVGQARSLLEEGKPLDAAIVEAARLRFRPILMTSLTCILGVLPLLVAEGAGASARKSLGLTVASGMLASTGLAVLLVPPLFVVLQGRRRPEVAGIGPFPGRNAVGEG